MRGGGGFAGFALRRLAGAVPTLFGVTLIIFFMVRVLPGDPARVLAGLEADQTEVDRIRVQLGLDKPAPVQYALFLEHAVRGDLGRSSVTQAPVVSEIAGRLGPTALLAATATVLAGALGIASGILVSTRQYTAADYTVTVFALAGVSIPVYWLGLMLMLVFAVFLHVLPAGGDTSPQSLILPAITLAAFSLAIIERMTRSSMLESLRQDYVRTARAKGLADRVVVYRHALRNALIPVVTVLGLQFGALIGGAILTETTFAWPGIGRLLVDAISRRDYPMIQGVVLLFAVTFVLVNLAVDLVYGYIDPRIHFG
jgi:peptide/nickel transport system permease protein/oligopeptide transport system permease protein